jgi:hypothetical protein
VLITFFGPVAFTQPAVFLRENVRQRPEPDPPLPRPDDDDTQRWAV